MGILRILGLGTPRDETKPSCLTIRQMLEDGRTYEDLSVDELYQLRGSLHMSAPEMVQVVGECRNRLTYGPRNAKG